MKDKKVYKALMVTEDTHQLIVVEATKMKLTVDEFIFFIYRQFKTKANK